MTRHFWLCRIATFTEPSTQAIACRPPTHERLGATVKWLVKYLENLSLRNLWHRFNNNMLKLVWKSRILNRVRAIKSFKCNISNLIKTANRLNPPLTKSRYLSTFPWRGLTYPTENYKFPTKYGLRFCLVEFMVADDVFADRKKHTQTYRAK